MAAPAVTARALPAGAPEADGYRTTIAFALNNAIRFWEIEVKPPELDGGEAINVSNMFNNYFHTKLPRHLVTLGEVEVKAAYRPVSYADIYAILNKNGSVTVQFPDLSTFSFWGFLRKFTPDRNVEGERPTATIIITPSMFDTALCVESNLVINAGAGSCYS